MKTEPMSSLPRTSRTILVEPASKRIPLTVYRLAGWQYLERSIHRILCGWARHQTAWEDVSAIHRHIWDQAEIVQRLRERMEQFPGGKADADVQHTLEAIADDVLQAPSFEDAMDGVYLHLTQALVDAYRSHAATVHPVHDAPTLSALREIIEIKESHRTWFEAYRTRRPHATSSAYRDRVGASVGLVANDSILQPPAKGGKTAGPVGVASNFRLRAEPAHPANARAKIELYPYIRCDFATNIESRRLFWAIGYMREKNLAIDMVRWLFDGHHMPWEWHRDVSRHMWDESRHGDSGMARLQDWGIGLDEVGLTGHGSKWLEKDPPPDMDPRDWASDVTIAPEEAPAIDAGRTLDPMTKEELYEIVFFICMIAEQGHFIVKNEAYDDFKGGEDLESAVMLLFVIIDETSHVQYGQKWLPELARQAGVDNTGYRERAATIRRERQEAEIIGTERCRRHLPRKAGFAPWDHYQALLERIRNHVPLTNADTCQERSPKPM